MAGQLWATNSLGGFMYSLELSDILRTAVQPLCKFRQFCDAKDFTDKGLHKGQTFTWNVYNDIATQGTTLTETSTVPLSNFTITQGTGTVTELANAIKIISCRLIQGAFSLVSSFFRHRYQFFYGKDCRVF